MARIKEKFLRNDVWLILILFLFSRLLIPAFGIKMDYGALLRNWQYLDLNTLHNNLLKGVWYDHTQPPLFNLILGVMVKLFGVYANQAFIVFFKSITLLNTYLLLSILKKVTRHPWLPLLLTLLYLLSPATMVSENELFYAGFITLLLLIATRFLLRLEENVNWKITLGLFLPLTLICLTRPMYHLVWLLSLSILVLYWYRKKPVQKTLFMGALLSLALVGSWYLKNYYIFQSFSSSSWLGMNMARNVFHDVPVKDSTQIASIEPFSRISAYKRFLPPGYDSAWKGLNDPVLLQEFKNDTFINEKHIGYITISHLYLSACKTSIRTHPDHFIKNVAQSAVLFFAPATRYPTTEHLSKKLAWYDLIYSFNFSYFAHGKHQRRIALVLSAIPKFLIYAMVFSSLARKAIRERKIPGGLPTLFITLIIAYIFLIGSVFEHYENMHFRYEAEPLFLVLVATVLSILLPKPLHYW